MFLLMVPLCLSVSHRGVRVCLMRSSKEIEFVSPINCPPGSMVIVICHDDHQKMKGFVIQHGSWDFAPHLMHSGDATHTVATWRVLTSGVNAPIVTLGFPAEFQFFMPWFLNFPSFHFPFTFSNFQSLF